MSKLRIIPLGGVGEIGKNMMAIEYGDAIVVVDCGVMFPEEEMLGVDLVIPDISYLLERKDKVLGILITHGHEDHIGALPYILPQLPVPVYATRLTQGLIEVRLREHGVYEGARLNVVQPGEQFSLGPFRVEYFRVAHSIPDATGLAIHTPVGTIVHTGDFKFDHTPVDGRPTDVSRLAQLGAQGVLLLLSDSTYAELPGYTPSEKVVGETLYRVIDEAPGRVIIACFASLISRIQQVIDSSAVLGRRLLVVGRSMQDNVQMAAELGYLHIPPGALMNPEELRRLPTDKVTIVATGSQGEPTSALVRMAKGDHRQVKITSGDTIVISASPIPGNEELVYRTIDNLYRKGARVLYSTIAQVHVHGHGSQEELKLMLSLVKPKYFVPVHGEYRHLVHHSFLAQSMGMPPEHTFVLENGDVLEVDQKVARVASKVSANYIYVDGLGDVGNVVLRDRKLLSRDGILVVVLTVDKQTGKLLAPPDIVSKGFAEPEESQAILEKTKDVIVRALSKSDKSPADWGFMSAKVKDVVGPFLYQQTKRRPMILPLSIEV